MKNNMDCLKNIPDMPSYAVRITKEECMEALMQSARHTQKLAEAAGVVFHKNGKVSIRDKTKGKK